MNLRERLAELEHDRWSRWMRHLFSRCTKTEQGAFVILAPDAIWWQKLMDTFYADLLEAKKDSDRKEADQTIAILEEMEDEPKEE